MTRKRQIRRIATLAAALIGAFVLGTWFGNGAAAPA